MDSAAAWARYMALGGGAGDAARVVALQYVEGEGPSRYPEGLGACEGLIRPAGGARLLSVDVASASTGAFGDDLAIECLATAYGRDIYVVRRRRAPLGSHAGIQCVVAYACLLQCSLMSSQAHGEGAEAGAGNAERPPGARAPSKQATAALPHG